MHASPDAAARGRRARRARARSASSSELRAKWDEELEAAARSQDFRERAVAYRAIGQFRFRQKIELLRRGLEDESPACRGSALLSLELLSRDHPGVVNGVRPLLHELVAHDENDAVRRLAVDVAEERLRAAATRSRSSPRLAEDDEAGRELREAAAKVAQLLRRKAGRRVRASGSGGAACGCASKYAVRRRRSETCV